MPSQQLEIVLQLIRANPLLETGTQATIEEGRASFERAVSIIPLPPDVVCQPVEANGVPGEWISTRGADDSCVIYYLHGGGYAIGSVNTHREMISRIARAAGARAFAINYRLAPEHPFPAAVEDAVAAYRWLLESGVSPARVVIAGDSAGGGLALATLLALRDAGVPLPAAAVCISPWTDLAVTGATMDTKAAVDPMIRKDDAIEGAKLYLAGADPKTPLASPLYADLSGLPHLLIQVGTSETLLDDSVRVAERARAAGIDVTLEQWDEMIHVWHFFAFILPEAQQAIARIGEFVREHVPVATRDATTAA